MLLSAQVDARTRPDDETAPTRAQALMLFCTLQIPDFVPRACSRARMVMEPMLDALAPQELLPAQDALGRICGAPTVACPPAIPVAVSGEVITREAVEVFRRCGIEAVSVVRA